MKSIFPFSFGVAQRSETPIVEAQLQQDHSPKHALWTGFGWPLGAFAALLFMLALTPSTDLTPHRQTFLETLAHHLGHEINSIWVGVSLLLLIVPSLWDRWRNGMRPVWAWRALDAILLDFLCVDALGKDIFLGLSRPNTAPTLQHPLRPGFPSGHATMAFLMAWLVWRRFPKLGPLWFGIAALIAWSRAEVHAHYPYQIVFGALLAMVLGGLITRRREGVLLPRLFLSDAASRRLLVGDAPG